MLSSYRALLGRDRARSLAVACGLGWLSFSGYGLAIILAVHAGTHSFAEAGAAVAAFSVGSGLLAPARGRSIDRRGPRALGYLAVGHLLGSGLLLIGCSGGHRAWLVFPGAALAGTFAPPIIATARSMWTDVAGPDLARTGHALNAALADAAQIASPALTGVLALLVSPSAALATLVVGAATAAWLLAGRDRPTKSRSSVPVAHRVWGVLRESAGLRTILACDFAIGGWLGGLEVTVIAVAASAGTPELGALPLASSAVGSIAVSLWSGTHRSSQSAGSRYVMGSVMVAAVLPLTLLAQSVGPIAAILVLAGAGVGLLNVAVFELLDHVVPHDRATEAFTWLTTSQAAGTAVGAAGAGRLAQTDSTAALLLVIAFAVLASAIALARRSALL
jgi:MFS family permease